MKNNARIFICMAVLMAAVVSGCEKNTDSPVTDPTKLPKEKYADQKAMRKFLKEEYMATFYYWNDSMPNVPISTDVDIFEFFDMNLVSYDRWSWMMDAEDYLHSESGVVTGTYGASLAQPIEYYKDYAVMVRYVYPGSPFDKEGVTRGWTLRRIDGTEVMELIRAKTFSAMYNKSPQTFTFSDTDGKLHTFTTESATQLNTRPGLFTKIFNGDDYKGLTENVGYFNYLGFKAGTDVSGKPMIDDIHEAMEIFRENNVKKLILDLRYNGGGDSRASDTLVSYLAPADADGKIYVKRSHNKDIAKELDIETEVKRLPGKSLDLEDLYIITGEGSASASEMVLNGLKPLMNVHHVGDTTYGKPNGMYVLYYPYKKSGYNTDADFNDLKYVFLPICFFNVNGVDKKIPDTGMIPELYIPDDLYHDFGVEEENIAACLYHIVEGKYPSWLNTRASGRAVTAGQKIRLAEEETDPYYGKYTVKR